MKKALALALVLAMAFSLAGVAQAAEEQTLMQGGWEYYINDSGEAVITAAPDSVKQTMGVFIPGELGGAQVAQFGSGVQTVMSNNKNSGSYVLYPEGLRIIAPISTYDFNDTVGWSVPASVTEIGPDAFHCAEDFVLRVYAGSFAERYARENDIPVVIIG